MVKLVIFDWDGTLFDSIDRICVCMLQAAEQAKAPQREPKDVQNIIGLSLDTAIKTIWPELEKTQLDKIAANYKAIYVKVDQVPPVAYDGVYELLGQLKAQGIKMAVATGKTRRGLDRVMSLTDTAGYFDATRCADEALSKPHPLMLEQILEELAIAPKDAIMIGDTEYDLNMANAAGMDCIGVSYGAHDEARLLACNPKRVVSNMNQLTFLLGNKE